MKYVIALALIFGAYQAQAENKTNRELTITSFVYVESGNHKIRAAELCGTVSGSTHLHDRVTVTSDYTTDGPGNYTVLLSEEGNFCAVIRTLTGRASAKFWRLGNSELALKVNAKIK